MRREVLAGLALGSILGALGFLRIALWATFFNVYGEHWFLGALTVGWRSLLLCSGERSPAQCSPSSCGGWASILQLLRPLYGHVGRCYWAPNLLRHCRSRPEWHLAIIKISPRPGCGSDSTRLPGDAAGEPVAGITEHGCSYSSLRSIDEMIHCLPADVHPTMHFGGSSSS